MLQLHPLCLWVFLQSSVSPDTVSENCEVERRKVKYTWNSTRISQNFKAVSVDFLILFLWLYLHTLPNPPHVSLEWILSELRNFFHDLACSRWYLGFPQVALCYNVSVTTLGIFPLLHPFIDNLWFPLFLYIINSMAQVKSLPHIN